MLTPPCRSQFGDKGRLLELGHGAEDLSRQDGGRSGTAMQGDELLQICRVVLTRAACNLCGRSAARPQKDETGAGGKDVPGESTPCAARTARSPRAVRKRRASTSGPEQRPRLPFKAILLRFRASIK